MFRRTALILGAIALASLSGCASVPRTASWAAPMPTDATQYLADMSVQYLRDPWPPAATVVWVAPTPKGAPVPAFDTALQRALLRAGYGVSTTQAGAHPLRYRVTVLGDGLVLRLDYDNAEVARYYRRDTAGQWTPVSPFTVRTAP